LIIFSNNYKADIFAASGSLGLTGDGYFWEFPLRWAGIIRPHDLTIITKTLTYFPRQGNYNRWKPWQTISFLKDCIINCHGLTNEGYQCWLGKSLDIIST
jgi:hypothetical protein